MRWADRVLRVDNTLLVFEDSNGLANYKRICGLTHQIATLLDRVASSPKSSKKSKRQKSNE
jgi:hypothetical protein